MLEIFCVINSIVIVLLIGKIVVMRKSAREIREQFSEKIAGDTNTLLSVSTNDKEMCRLANAMNRELQKLRQQQIRYMQGDMELKNAVTNISHDLRTPLTAIRAYLELLDNTEKSIDATRYIEVIKNRTEVLQQLTEELFLYSRITSPEHDITLELLAINGILEESMLSFYAAFQEKGITPEIHISEKKVMRYANREALSRVFANVLHNAWKYSDGDLEIHLTESGQILFANTASQLSNVEVNRLFDRFYTVENARKSTGLGLAIARSLVEQMHGTIMATYEQGKLKIAIELTGLL